MLASSMRRLAGGRELVRRSISKTSSDAITSRQQVQNVQVGEQSSSAKSKWARLSKHNNNRALSTLQTKVAPAASASMASKEESREFMAVFPDIVRDLTDAGRQTDIPEVTKWYSKVLQYNVPNGKKNRGLAMVGAYKLLEDPAKLTPENLRLAHIMGWCVEMLQAVFLIMDDIIDRSETRRGIPCWYRNHGVGVGGINDSLLLEQGIYTILRRHFSGLPCYAPAIELFHEVTMKTAMGQSLDMMSNKDGSADLSQFTMKRYNAIVKYKTAYYSFQLPVALAMYMSGKYDPEIHRQAKTILLEMGHFFQVQDDFIDCFGDSGLTGKKGTDIREGKCSWLIVVALQRATPKQRELLEANYGRPEPEAVEAVRNLYEELGLPNTYSIYEEESYNLIRTHIQQISKGLPHDLFFKFMDRIYKRAA